MDPRALRDATRAEHEATEATMPLGGADLTRETYIRVLQALEPMVRSWERWAEHNAPADLRVLVERRRRSHLLRADLRALGAESAGGREPAIGWDAVVQRRAGDVSAEEFEAAFLGAMYVMEGSTLGGRFIARHVETVLGLEPGVGDAYFQGHGESTGSLWRDVTARIAAVPETRAEWVIEVARATFRAFGEALGRGLAAPEAMHP